MPRLLTMMCSIPVPAQAAEPQFDHLDAPLHDWIAMRTHVNNLATTLLFLCIVLLPLQSRAQAYRADAHGFACTFPGKVDKSTVRTRDGLVLTSFMSTAPDKSWGGMVITGFADPREAANRVGWFQGFARGVGAHGFTLANPRRVSIQGRPAVRYDVVSAETTGVGFVVIDEDRFVSILGMTLVGKDQSMLEPFLQTLKILDR